MPTVKISNVYTNTSAPASTAAPSPTKINQGWMYGDTSLHRLLVRVRTNVSTASSLVTRGRARFLGAVDFSTDKHGPIIQDVDGIALQQWSHASMPIGQGHQVTDTQDGVHNFILPFRNPYAARPSDTSCDFFRVSVADLTFTWLAPSNIESTGGTTLSNHDVRVHAEFIPSPVDPADRTFDEVPLLMPHLAIIKTPISSTQTGLDINLPYGDRIYRKLVVAQRSATNRSELNNTILGAATTDLCHVKVNDYAFVDKLPWIDLQNSNLQDYPQYSSSRGYGIIDFQKLQIGGGVRSGGGRLVADGLSVIDQQQGRIVVSLDVTSGDQVWILLDSVKNIPLEAKRPERAKAA